MTTKLDDALQLIKTLPEVAQDSIADRMFEVARLRQQLNSELEEAETRMDNGEGIPAEQVISELKDRQKRHDV